MWSAENLRLFFEAFALLARRMQLPRHCCSILQLFGIRIRLTEQSRLAKRELLWAEPI